MFDVWWPWPLTFDLLILKMTHWLLLSCRTISVFICQLVFQSNARTEKRNRQMDKHKPTRYTMWYMGWWHQQPYITTDWPATDRCSCARRDCCKQRTAEGQSIVLASDVDVVVTLAAAVVQSPSHLSSPVAESARWTGNVIREIAPESQCPLQLTPSVWPHMTNKYISNLNIKSFLSHKAHQAALIVVSLALSQTAVYTTRPRTWG